MRSQASPKNSELLESLRYLTEQEREELDRLLTANQPEIDAEKAPEWAHEGQREVWSATERFILMLAGTQGGKTVLAPWWTLREIQRTFRADEPNDHLVASPTFTLQDVKLAPEYHRLFVSELGLAKFTGQPNPKLVFTPEGVKRLTGSDRGEITIRFGYATKPESLESATYKSAVGDEFGQKDVKSGSIDAILRRLTIHRGRFLIPTTPYQLGWLKTRFHDRALAKEPGYRLVRFESRMNPAFPLEEWERAQKDLPKWKFDLFYRAIFTRPAGVIYDCFDTDEHLVESLPEGWEKWRRYVGIDFGPVNTAAVFLAERPTDKTLFVYRTYHAGGKTPAEHVEAICGKEPVVPFSVGGAPSEDEWREKFARAGLPVARPDISDVEVGIDSVYEQIKRGRLLFLKSLDRLVDDLMGYSWEVDEYFEPIPHKIADKHSYHRLDALRYAISHLRGPAEQEAVKTSRIRRGNYLKNA